MCLAKLSDPLREICRQKMEFKLTDACHVAFQQCKEEISKNITLLYFNLASPTILQTDASKKGFGVVLLQILLQVMFASRALTGSEKNYQNLEMRVSSNDLGNGKIPLFPLQEGVHTGKSDQMPLVLIYKKHMVEISPRIQRLVVSSFPYQPFTCQVPERSGNSTGIFSK